MLPDRAAVGRILEDQRIRYLISGSLVAGLYIVVYATLIYALPQVGYLVVLLIAQGIIIAVAFPLYRRFVFRSTGNLPADLGRFAGVWGVNLVFGTVLIAVLVSRLHLNPVVGQVITVIVVSVSSFLGHRLVSFRHKSASGAGHAAEERSWTSR